MRDSLTLLTKSGFFDSEWYTAQYAEMGLKGLSPVEHFLHHGAALRTNPSPLFDSGFYLDSYPDVRDGGINPLVHYLQFGQAENRMVRKALTADRSTTHQPTEPAQEMSPLDWISQSAFFDNAWYKATYAQIRFKGLSPEEHFLHHGAKLRTNPSPLFDSGFYLDSYPDVRDGGINPLVHYLQFGQRENRLIRRVTDHTIRSLDEIVVELKDQTRKIIAQSKIFDDAWYESQYGDELGTLSPRLHYVQLGSAKGNDPSPYFQTKAYYTAYPEVRNAGLNALAHYIMEGHKICDHPCPEFDARWYESMQPDGLGPYTLALEHFLTRSDRRQVHTCPGIDATWLAQVEEFIRGDFKDGIQFLRHLDHTQPTVANNIRRYGLTRPTTFDQFINDEMVISPDALPKGLLDAAAKAIPADTFVSIIMPTWNRADVICHAVESALEQTWANYELIIVDDGSSDDTVKTLKLAYADHLASGRIKLIEQPNGGVCRARNSGLEQATGSVIAFLDSDNTWRPDTLRLLLAGLFSHPDAETAYAAYLVHDSAHDIHRVQGAPFDRRALIKSNYIDLNAFVCKRRAEGTPLQFNESLTRLVDWELILGLTRDVPPVFVPAVTVDYFISDGLNNITLTQPIGENADRIYDLHRYEYFRSGLIGAQRFAISHAKAPRGGATQMQLLEQAAQNVPPVRTVSLAIVLDADNADQFPDLTQANDYWFVDAVYVKTAEGYVPHAGGAPLALRDMPETVFYYPTTPANILRPDTLYAMLLSVSINGLDLAFASFHPHGYGAAGDVVLKSVRDQVMVSRVAAMTWLRDLTLPEFLTGRVLRLETRRMGDAPVLTQLNRVFGNDFATDQSGQMFWTRHSNAHLLPAVEFDLTTLPSRPHPKDTMIVAGMKTSVGGVERLSQNLVQAWREKYHCVYLALEPTGKDQGDLSTDIVDTGALLINGAEIVSPDKRDLLLQHLAEGYSPKALYVMNGSMWLVNNADLLRRVFANTRIVDQQVYDHAEGWINHYHKRAIQSFDSFVAVNRKIEQVFADTYGLKATQIRYIPHGYDTAPGLKALADISREAACAEYGLDPAKKNILFAGRLVDQKRPLDFLDIARQRQQDQPDEHYVLIGDGALAAACQKKIREDKLTNVTYIPFVPGMSGIYRAADVLLVTSAYEGLPLVLVEAVCMGVPVVATDVGQIRETVEKFTAGFATAQPGDLAQLNAHLDKLLAAPTAFGTQADQARAEFSVDLMANRYEAAAQIRTQEASDA